MLAVDDQPENLELVAEILTEEGYRIQLAADGEAALDGGGGRAARLHRARRDDAAHRRLRGLPRASRPAARTRFIPVVMLTALSAVDDKVSAFDAGADDFLNKPVHAHELRARVRSLVRIKRLRDELDTAEDIIVSMIQALERKDPRNAGHSQRVAGRAMQLARRLGLGGGERRDGGPRRAAPRPRQDRRQRAAARPRRRSPAASLAEYQRHPVLGEQILAPLRSFAGVRALIRHHHERLDGHGYPDRLGGSELDVATQVVALANLYDHVQQPPRRRRRGGAARSGAARRAAARPGRGGAGAGGGRWRRRAHAGPALDVASGWSGCRRRRRRAPAASWSSTTPRPTARCCSTCSSERRPRGDHRRHRRGGACRPRRRAGPTSCCSTSCFPTSTASTSAGRSRRGRRPSSCRSILVTAHYELRDRTLSARAGADDFLTYPDPPAGARPRACVAAAAAALLPATSRSTRASSSRWPRRWRPRTPTPTATPSASATSPRAWAAASASPRRSARRCCVAGLLHDIGKIGVPESLLNKPGRLTEEELLAVMAHPVLGEEICRPLRSARQALPMIRHHHERYDGSGYPDRLAGEAIPFGARIMGVADAYDALTSSRSYRDSLTSPEALSVLDHETRVGRWDPRVMAALRGLVVG